MLLNVVTSVDGVAGTLIVAVLLFIGAAVLALVGKKALAHADPTPKRAISEAQQTIATIKGQS